MLLRETKQKIIYRTQGPTVEIEKRLLLGFNVPFFRGSPRGKSHRFGTLKFSLQVTTTRKTILIKPTSILPFRKKF